MLATIQSDMVELYAVTGNYDKELEMARACFAIATKIKDYTLLSQVYRHFGQMYTRNEQLDSALITYENYFISAANAGFRKYSHLCYNNIGNIFYKQNNFPEAIKNYLAALTIGEEIGDKRDIAISFSRLGNIYNKQNNYPDALKKYMASLKLFEELGDK